MNSFQPWLKILGSQGYCSLNSLSTFSSFRVTKSILMKGSAKPRGTELDLHLFPLMPRVYSTFPLKKSVVYQEVGAGTPFISSNGGRLQMLRKE